MCYNQVTVEKGLTPFWIFLNDLFSVWRLYIWLYMTLLLFQVNIYTKETKASLLQTFTELRWIKLFLRKSYKRTNTLVLLAWYLFLVFLDEIGLVQSCHWHIATCTILTLQINIWSCCHHTMTSLLHTAEGGIVTEKFQLNGRRLKAKMTLHFFLSGFFFFFLFKWGTAVPLSLLV